MANAFNQIRRDKVLEKVKEVAPQLFPMAWQAYGKPTKLLFGEHLLMSCEGVQQGDVLGSLLFSLAIKDMMNECKSPFNSWYLDDGVFAAEPNTIEQDYLRLVDSAASLGLCVKPDKCQISILNPRNRGVIQSLLKIEPLFKVIGIASLDLLGAPLLPPAVEPFLEKKLEDLSRLNEKLMLLDNHDAFFLLKNCFSLPKIMYLLRCAPCFMCPDTLERFDLMLRSSLQAVLNVTLNDRAWEVATLPVRLGGLGIRKASDLAVPTFLSSAFGSNAVAGTLLQESIVSRTIYFMPWQHWNGRRAWIWTERVKAQWTNPSKSSGMHLFARRSLTHLWTLVTQRRRQSSCLLQQMMLLLGFMQPPSLLWG